MSPRPRLLLFLLASLHLLPAAACSQYMYLDANGDGIHTSADVVDPSDTTFVDVWLYTDRNRDGSAAVCSAGEHPFTINSYVIQLHAIGGAVTFENPINRQPQWSVSFGSDSNETEFYMGWGGSPDPPGLYHLATVPILVAAGTPSVRIIP